MLLTFIENGLETITTDDDFEIIEAVKDEVNSVSFYEVEKRLLDILEKWNGFSKIVPISDKWKDGTIVKGLSSKEIPFDTFFHKMVMLRNRFRVKEQKINASKKLGEQYKINIAVYNQMLYGSLTTFNVLFKSNSQQVKGESSV